MESATETAQPRPDYQLTIREVDPSSRGEARDEANRVDSPEEDQPDTNGKNKRNPNCLIDWIDEHPFNPYPTKSEKAVLAECAGMTIRQLNDWFANARRNIKKYSYETWKKKKSGESLKMYSNSSNGEPPPNATVGKTRGKLQLGSCTSLTSTQFPPKFGFDTATTECIPGPIPYGGNALPLILDKAPPPLLGGIPKQIPIPMPMPVVVPQSPYSRFSLTPSSFLSPPGSTTSFLSPGSTTSFLSPGSTASFLPPPPGTASTTSSFLSPGSTASFLSPSTTFPSSQTRFTASPPPLLRQPVWPCTCVSCRASIPQQNMAPAPSPSLPLTSMPWTQMTPPPVYYDIVPVPPEPVVPPPDLLTSPSAIHGKDILGEYDKEWNNPSSMSSLDTSPTDNDGTIIHYS